MTLSEFLSKMKLNPKDAEVIFDRDEPVGRPTDVVMPRRYWFKRKGSNKAASRSSSSDSQKS
jgi:hypothetical protein